MLKNILCFVNLDANDYKDFVFLLMLTPMMTNTLSFCCSWRWSWQRFCLLLILMTMLTKILSFCWSKGRCWQRFYVFVDFWRLWWQRFCLLVDQDADIDEDFVFLLILMLILTKILSFCWFLTPMLTKILSFLSAAAASISSSGRAVLQSTRTVGENLRKYEEWAAK